MSEFPRKKIDAAQLPPAFRAKFPDYVLEEAFVPAPKRLLRALPVLFPGNPEIEDLGVLLSVVDFKRPKLTRLPSLDFLAFVAGMNPDQFERSLERLKGRGWIHVEGTREALKVDLEPFFEKIREATPT